MDEYHWTLTYEGELEGTGSVTARVPFSRHVIKYSLNLPLSNKIR